MDHVVQLGGSSTTLVGFLNVPKMCHLLMAEYPTLYEWDWLQTKSTLIREGLGQVLTTLLEAHEAGSSTTTCGKRKANSALPDAEGEADKRPKLDTFAKYQSIPCDRNNFWKIAEDFPMFCQDQEILLTRKEFGTKTLGFVSSQNQRRMTLTFETPEGGRMEVPCSVNVNLYVDGSKSWK